MDEDPVLYLYTSLTAGSSHIITATSRMETILKANKIPFSAVDVATDEKARKLWGRRSRGKKIPGLVRHGEIIGDLEQVEEWNEYGELVDQIGAVPNVNGPGITPPSMYTSNLPKAPAQKPKPKATPSATPTPGISRTGSMIQIQEPDKTEPQPQSHAMRQLGNEAARIAEGKQKEKLAAAKAAQDVKAAEANKSAEDVKSPVAETESKPTTLEKETEPEPAAAKTETTTSSVPETCESKTDSKETVDTSTEKLEAVKLDDKEAAPVPATEPEQKLAAARAAHEAAIPAELQTTKSTSADTIPPIKGIDDAAVVSAPAGTIEEVPSETATSVEESLALKEEPTKEAEAAKVEETSKSKIEDPKDGEKATESVVD